MRRLVFYLCLMLFNIVLAARFQIQTHVPQARIYIDDQYIETTDNNGSARIDLDLRGRHMLRIVREGYNAYSQFWEFNPTQPVIDIPYDDFIGLDDRGSYSELYIQSNGSGIAVYVNGTHRGLTGSDGRLGVRLERGSEYQIRLEKQGFQPLKNTIMITKPVQEVEWVLESQSSLSWLIYVFMILFLLAIGMTVYYFWISGLKVSVPLLPKTLKFPKISPRFKNPFRFLVGFLPHPRRFDRYRLGRMIGRGGMASVYLAKDLTTGETVALKIMDEALLKDQDLVNKFLREGRVLTEINTDYPTAPIVHALRYGRENDKEDRVPYIALEYVPGDDLLSLIEKNPGDVQVALKVIDQMCESLSAAHAKHVWHRDITPDNILLQVTNPTLKIKLIDFGVAKHEYTQAKTLDGSIYGKPPYMSPEQCRNEDIDNRSDIYSLGIVFYSLLTGKPPFTDRNPLKVMRMHETESVPPLPESIPQEIRDLVHSMLSKERDNRPSTVDDVRIIIRQFQSLNQNQYH